jgi:hypothetical protein
VNKDVRFEEGKALRRSLKSRVSSEEDAKTHIDVLEGTQPQVSSTPLSRVIGSPCIALGSQL